MEMFKNQELVWITLINEAYIDFTMNFLSSMKRASCAFTLIVYYVHESVKDKLKVYDNCICVDASVFARHKLTTANACWREQEYKKICFTKLDAIKYTRQILQPMNVKYVGFIDTDIVLFSDPTSLVLEYFRTHEDCTILAQCDEASKTCMNSKNCALFCSGFIIFKHDLDNNLFSYTDDMIYKRSGDQQFLQHECRVKKIIVHTLPKNICMNGGYTHAWTKPVSKEACLLHFNHIIGNTKKRDKMKEMDMWYL